MKTEGPPRRAARAPAPQRRFQPLAGVALIRAALIPTGLVCTGLACSALAACGGPGVESPEPAAEAAPAELVVTGAAIWTADPANPRATALAVRDGRLIAVGDDAEILALAGSDTRRVDAAGARVLPGLIDAHLHLLNAARAAANLELRPAVSAEDLLARVAAHAAKLPPDAWVLGRGWSAESWPDPTPPSASDLEQACGGRPAWLVRMDGHSGLASGAALALAGIDAAGPPDPVGGRIGRDAEGLPTGALFDTAADLVTAFVPADARDRLLAGLESATAELAAWGVTRVGAIEPAHVLFDLLPELDRAGRLPVFVHGTISEDLPPARWRERFEQAARNPRPAERVTLIGFKAYADGSLGSRTAWLFEPYADEPGNSGLAMAGVLDGTLAQLIAQAAGRGLQPTIHAIGDRANSAVLDLYAELDPERRAELRPRIEHAQHLAAADVERFGRLGVVASMQPSHKADDGRYAEDRLGAARLEHSYAYRSLLARGATLAFGSDWPVVSADPMAGLQAAVDPRTTEGLLFVVDEAIGIEQALLAYTRGSAYALHAEGEAGMLRAGLSADFGLWSGDAFTTAPENLGELRCLWTVVAGEGVHDVR